MAYNANDIPKTEMVAIDKTAAIRIATVLGWEPKREFVGLTDEERRLVRKWTPYNQFMSASEYAEAVQIATEEEIFKKNT